MWDSISQRICKFLCEFGSEIHSQKCSLSQSRRTALRSLDDLAIVHPAVKSHYITLPTSTFPIPSKIFHNSKFYPYFKDCIGALDGTHCLMSVPEAMAIPYRSRKGGILQNVLAVCSFDMRFVYVLSGWEGSAPDTVVYKDARENGFLIPPGRYNLGDGGYSMDRHTLIPYQKVQYHLREQGKATTRPQKARELYNLCHAMLRNIIERIFGVLERKWRILEHPLSYSVDTQADFVTAICIIFNSIRQSDPWDSDVAAAEDLDEAALGEDNDGPAVVPPQQGEPQEGPIATAELRAMERFRDEIAEAMWTEYKARTKGRK
ncbi:nuclease HARBI1, partial [Phenoliferia sp. Uapishka_3]